MSLLFPIVVFDRYKKAKKKIASLERARKSGRASIRQVQASAYVSFREYEDLGALWVFQTDNGKLFVLRGQEYYENSRFPCLEFEIVSIPEVLFTVRSKSPKVKPIMEFDEKTMRDVSGIKDRAVLDGKLGNVVEILSTHAA